MMQKKTTISADKKNAKADTLKQKNLTIAQLAKGSLQGKKRFTFFFDNREINVYAKSKAKAEAFFKRITGDHTPTSSFNAKPIH